MHKYSLLKLKYFSILRYIYLFAMLNTKTHTNRVIDYYTLCSSKWRPSHSKINYMKKVKSTENSYFLPIFVLLNSYFLPIFCEKNSYFPIF